MIWLLPPPSPVSEFDRRHTGRLRKRDILLRGVWGGGGGAYSYDGEKAYESFNTLWSLDKIRVFHILGHHFYTMIQKKKLDLLF